MIMYGCLVPVCGDLSENCAFQCSGCCFFFLPAMLLWVMNPITLTSTPWCKKIEFRKKDDRETFEKWPLSLLKFSVFSAAETPHYMSNEPRSFSPFLLPFFWRQRSCDTASFLFYLRGTTTTQRIHRLLISSFYCLFFKASLKHYKLELKVLPILLPKLRGSLGDHRAPPEDQFYLWFSGKNYKADLRITTKKRLFFRAKKAFWLSNSNMKNARAVGRHGWYREGESTRERENRQEDNVGEDGWTEKGDRTERKRSVRLSG